jgi:glycosyltransferase involved in cell wall biosynthesis
MSALFQINATVNAGSTGKIAEGIGQIALSQGWKSYIAYARRMALSHSQIIRIGNKWDIYRHILMTRLFDRQGLSSCMATKKLIRQIREIQPDIIHLHNIHGYYLNYPLLFKFLKEYDKPVVWTLHDCWAFTGHCTHFILAECDKWKSECCRCPQKNIYPKSVFVDNSKFNYRRKKQYFNIPNLTIVTPSKWLAGLVSKSFLQQHQIKVINNGIDLSVFNPIKAESQKNEKAILIGVANVWTERKGLNDFIQLSKLLPENIQIVLVGLKKNQIVTLPKSIIGIERTNNAKKLAELYSCADVFVNPTYEDTFPTTNLESLACGTPVITYKTGGSAESISEKTGLVVEQGNIMQLLFGINELLSKGKEYYSVNCINRAKELYDKNDRFEDYIELYKQVIVK